MGGKDKDGISSFCCFFFPGARGGAVWTSSGAFDVNSGAAVDKDLD